MWDFQPLWYPAPSEAPALQAPGEKEVELRARATWTLLWALLGTPLWAQSLPAPEQYKLRVEFFEWHPTLTSQLQFGTTGLPGDLLDLKNDLGIADSNTFEIVGTVQFSPGQKIRGSYTKLDYSGTTNASRTFNFNGSTYTVGSRVLSSLQGSYFQAHYEWDFIKSQGGYLGLMIGGELVRTTASIQAPDLAISSSSDISVPVPTIGAAGRLYVGRISIGGDASGLTIGKRGNLYDLNGAAQFHVSDRLAVEGGYRLFHGKGTQGLQFLTFQQSGWHFGAELSL